MFFFQKQPERELSPILGPLPDAVGPATSALTPPPRAFAFSLLAPPPLLSLLCGASAAAAAAAPRKQRQSRRYPSPARTHTTPATNTLHEPGEAERLSCLPCYCCRPDERRKRRRNGGGSAVVARSARVGFVLDSVEGAAEGKLQRKEGGGFGRVRKPEGARGLLGMAASNSRGAPSGRWAAAAMVVLMVVLGAAAVEGGDGEALMAVKAGFGNAANALVDWDGGRDHYCAWRGVTCDNASFAVLALCVPSPSNLFSPLLFPT